MPTFTRVPASLVDNAYPVRWIGTAAEREALATATGVDALTVNDKRFLFLEVDDEGKALQTLILRDITDDGPVWLPFSKSVVNADDVAGLKEAVANAIGESDTVTDAIADAISNNDTITTAITEAVDSALTGSPVIEPEEGSDTIPDSIKFIIAAGDETKVATVGQVRELFLSDADKHYKGVFKTPEALQAGVTDPEEGAYAVVASTDSIWVWDADNSSGGEEESAAWRDSKITGKVDINTQVIAGDGLEGGGSLATNITIKAKFGTAANTICAGDDARLERGIKWKGTAEERAALTVTEADVYKIFMQTDEGSDVATLWVLTSASPATWVQAGAAPTPEREPITVESGVVNAGTSTITLTSARPADEYYLEVYLSGVRQMSNSWTLDDTNTIITLGGELPSDIEYDVVIQPKK